MEQINQINSGYQAPDLVTLNSSQADVWVSPNLSYRQTNSGFQSNGSQPSKGRVHACQASQRNLEQASDRLRRANRDLGETAAFIAASLTTVTAVEAVINIAVEKIGLSLKFLQTAFGVYILLLVMIFIWGTIRARSALSKRYHAEQDFDQAKKCIFEFCPVEQWPKPEE
jgi:hypothetical protein